MRTFVIIWTIAFIAVIAVMCTVDLSLYVPSIYTVFNKNKPLVTGIIYILLISIFIWLIVALYLLKKYSFKVEKLSLGGVNVLFNESGTLYRKSIKNHLDSNRAIFKGKPMKIVLALIKVLIMVPRRPGRTLKTSTAIKAAR